MSTTIDNRVVEMRFDNQQFERGASTTLTTLEKLKQSLNLTGATKGFENVDSAAKKVNFSALTNGIQTVETRFSYMQATIQHQLNRIVDSAVNTGKRLASAFTIEPIKTGFQEYETQINAVQTILANTSSKGTTLQEVNAALDTLNTYADKTIYNFTEMTRNIGTFTAAGVDLDKSVSAIQGIANLAAVSGSTSQQASTAMYQLSQALAAGRVSLMDWNSVVNAGMGGQVFQDALKRTAKNMGIVVDETKSFRESISGSDTWLSSDVLLKTLEQFTMAAEEGSAEWEKYKKSLLDDGYTEAQATEILKMANTATDAATKVKTFTQLMDTLKESVQSGWTQSWEILIGDFGEAKETLTEISNVLGEMIGNTAEARNALLTGGLSSGWKQLLNAGIVDEEGYKDSIKTVAKEHGVALDEMVKKAEEEGKSFEDVLTESLKSGEISSNILTESVTHLADSMRNMSEKERAANGYTKEHLESIEALENGLKNGSISMDEFVEKMSRPSGRENIIQALWNAFNGLMSVIKPIKEAFRDIFPPMTAEQLYNATVKIREFSEKLSLSEETAEKVKRTFKGIFSVFDIFAQVLKSLVIGAIDLIKNFAGIESSIIDSAASFGDWMTNLRDSVKEGNVFGKTVKKITNFVSITIEKIKEFGSEIKECFTVPGYTGFVGFLKSVWELATLLGSKAVDALTSIGGTIAEVFGENSFSDALNSGIFATLMASLYKFVSNINKPLNSIIGRDGIIDNITGILDDVRGCFEAYQQQLKAGTLIKIASAIGILAASIFVISLIDSESLGHSLAAITVLFAELVGSLALFTKIGGNLKGVIKIIPLIASISSALLILSVALKIMSTMNISEMGVALLGLTVGMGTLILAVNLLPDKKVTNAAKALLKLSTSLLIFSLALKIIGSMSWNELAVGLTGVVVGLGVLVAAVNLLPKDMSKRTLGIVGLATSLVILSGALKIMGSMSWDEIGRGLTGLVVSLLAMSAATRIMPKNMLSIGVGLIGVTTALVILSGALKIMGSMSWDEIGRGLSILGGALLELSIGLNLMRGTLSGSAALLVAALALGIMTPVLINLGNLSWGAIAKGLIVLAGAFAVIGVAGTLLSPIIPALLGLSGAFALFGIATLGIGVGLMLISAGISSLATAMAVGATSIVASLTVIVVGLLDLIPSIITKIGEGIVAFCKVIGDCAPQIADSVLKLISEVLKSCATYIPIIADSLFELLIGVLDVLAARMPELVTSTINVINAFFQGVLGAFGNIDTTSLLQGAIATGLLTALMYALSGVASLTPAAMLGVLGVGAVVAELALVLAAIGGLAQIPGLSWLIEEGGNFLEIIGTALGQFVGGLIGGIGKGITGALPEMGADLSTFMSNVEPFIEGAKKIDNSVLEGVKNLADAMKAITKAEFVDIILSGLFGGSTLSQFGAEIAEFAPYMKEYADTISGIDSSAVEASANAAKALSELTSSLYNNVGNNNIVTFAEQLIPFGEGLRGYADAVAGIDSTAITASAEAAKALADISNILPNEGGMVAWFTGDNSISKFGGDLIALGNGIKGYATAIAGVDIEAIVNSTNAAKALAEMTSIIPNNGGIVAWFTGENSVSRFSTDLINLGHGLKGFALATIGIIPENIIGATNAAKALAEMVNVIPNQGGIVAWFTGENSVSRFSTDLVNLGFGLRNFAIATIGIIPENITAAANAARTLAEMTNTIPNEGGIKAWFTGENSVSKFSTELPLLGLGLKGFSDSIVGVVPENITAAANAANVIAQMTNTIPNEGGIKAWFSGESSVSKFSTELPALGAGLKGFSDSVVGIVPESMITAAESAKTLAEMTNTIPNEGGIKAWFTGENSVSKLATELPLLGAGLKGFSDSIVGIVPENIVSAANAAKALAEMTNVIPKEGGIKAWFSGENSVSKFASNLPALGDGLKGFSDSIVGIIPENVTAAANAAKTLAQMTETTPKDTSKLISFGTNLVSFGSSLQLYFTSTSGITAEAVGITSNVIDSVKKATTIDSNALNSSATSIDKLVNSIKKMSSITANSVSGFSKAMTTLGKTNVKNLVSSFESATPKMTKIGANLIESFNKGIKSSQNTLTSTANNVVNVIVNVLKSKSDIFTSIGVKLMNAFAKGITFSRGNVSSAVSTIVNTAISSINNYYDSFYSAGSNLVDGFASGISENSYKGAAKAAAMASAAYEAAKAELDINSPSKIFRGLGYSVPEGFAIGIDKLTGLVGKSAISMSNIAIGEVSKSIANITDYINSDVDTQPHIRPVLDLTNIKSGARTINSILGVGSSVGVLTKVDAINDSFHKNIQNRSNHDIVSAIDGLRKDLGNVNSTSYTINGITYDDGSNVSSAVSSLIRAAKIGRRV